MKKIILLSVAAFLSLHAFAQITLEQTYDSAGIYSDYYSPSELYVVNLEVDNDKYVVIDRIQKSVRLYNMNHTLWKTISFASAIDLVVDYNFQAILYISQHLFDLDDEIEFLYVDQYTLMSTCVTQVINEDGSILFTANNQGPWVRVTAPQQQLPIYNTSAGTKMILSGADGYDINAYVYSLGGTLTTGLITYHNTGQGELNISLPYPNPT